MQILDRSGISEAQSGVSENEAQLLRDEGIAVQTNALHALRACNVATEDEWMGMLAAAVVVPEDQLLPTSEKAHSD